MYEGLLDRESLTAEDGVKYFRDTLRAVPPEIFSAHTSKKRKYSDGSVNRQVFIAPEALERCLNGHVTGVHHERRAKTIPVPR